MGLNSLHNFTPQDVTLAANIMMGFTLPGTGLSLLVLAAFAVVAWNPVSRPHLDRVSFRLLTYAIIANIFFAVAFILDTSLHGPSPGCSFVAFLTNICLLFSACLLFCIALNLQLVLVHGVNGNKMEKWYLIGSTLVASALNVPVYALNQFGWNETNSTCWFSNPDDGVRLRWTIGTQSFWVLLIASGETVMFVVVVLHILKCDRINRKTMGTSHQTTVIDTISRGKTDSAVSATTKKGYTTKYRNIILRIGLYPLVSCILNFSTVALDLYQTVDGVNTNLQFGLSILDLVLYGLRTFFYAALAATDPSFLRGLRVLRKSQSSQLSGFHAATRSLGVLSTTQGSFPGSGIVGGISSIGSGGDIAVHVELQQVRHLDDGAEYDAETGGTTKRSSFYDDDGKVARGEGDGGPMGGVMRMSTVRGPGGGARADGSRWEEDERGGVEEEDRASREFTRQI